MELLVFRLIGPMASWGTVTVGESRHSAAHPSRSALLGLLAAALGVRRDDDEAHAALAAHLRLAVKVPAPGFPLRDYHTVQNAPPERKWQPRLRRQALASVPRHKLDTFLSAREYRCDAVAIVAVAAAGMASHGWLQRLLIALQRPVFPLYLGRRACPRAAPLAPHLGDFASLKAGLDAFDAALLPELSEVDATHALQIGVASHYYWDIAFGADGLAPGLGGHGTLLQQLDEPLSRERWQFGPRQEYMRTEIAA